MGRPFIRGLAAATAWVAMSSAGASVETRIAASDFRVELAALAPGAKPAVSFAGGVGSTSESDCSASVRPTDQHRTVASGQAFGQALTATSAYPFSGSTAILAGDVFGAGAFIRTSAYASSLVPQASGAGTIGLVNDVSSALFTLAPWTVMRISANVYAAASSTGANDFEFADSGLLMAIGDDEGSGPQRAFVNFNAFAFGGLGAVDDTETAFVSLSYENDTNAAILGLFSGYVASYASSGLSVSAVPEPAQALLLMAGLLAAGVTAGRRRRRGHHPAAQRKRPACAGPNRE
jgi:hypothetical protein